MLTVPHFWVVLGLCLFEGRSTHVIRAGLHALCAVLGLEVERNLWLLYSRCQHRQQSAARCDVGRQFINLHVPCHWGCHPRGMMQAR